MLADVFTGSSTSLSSFSSAGPGARMLLAVGLGAGAGLGLTLIITGLGRRPDDPSPARPDARPGGGQDRLLIGQPPRRGVSSRSITSPVQIFVQTSVQSQAPLVRAAGAVVIAVLTGVLTGWVVAALAAGIGAWLLLGQFLGAVEAHRGSTGGVVGTIGRSGGSAAVRLARLEALAAWTESLAATLAAAAGLEQALLATTRTPPAALADPLRQLGEAIMAGARLPDALAAFARDVDDATADAVVAALLLAAIHGGASLGEPLSQLAEATREQVTAARQIETGRSQIRTDTRLVAGLAGVVIVALVIFNRSFLTPYDSLLGQVVLAVVLAMAGGSLWWMRRLAKTEETARVVALTTSDPSTTTTTTRTSATTTQVGSW